MKQILARHCNLRPRWRARHRCSASHSGSSSFPTSSRRRPPPSNSPKPSAPGWSPSGTFIHANPSDPVHYGKGRVSVYERSGLPRIRLRGRAWAGVPRLSGAQGIDPIVVRPEGCDVRRPRRLARLQGQPALCDPGRRRSEGLSERDHLVRRFRRAHFAGRSDHNHCRKVKTGSLGTVDRDRYHTALDNPPRKQSPGPSAGAPCFAAFWNLPASAGTSINGPAARL